MHHLVTVTGTHQHDMHVHVHLILLGKINVYYCICYVSLCKFKSLQAMVIISDIYTSGKNFIKITSVGMGAAKSNETR